MRDDGSVEGADSGSARDPDRPSLAPPSAAGWRSPAWRPPIWHSPAFVGRDEVTRALEAARDRALRFNAPQLMTVVGAAGMGKSRFLSEWTSVQAGRGTFRGLYTRTGELRGTGTEPTEVAPFGLLAALLRARFGIEGGADQPQALEQVRAELSAVFGDRRVAEVAGLLGRFLGLALPDSPLGQALATRPDQETELALAVFCRFLEADAAQQPLMVVVDDLHLADDRSLDLLADLPSAIGEAPLLLVVAARPELFVRRPSWGRGQGSQARVDLAPLSRLEMDVFIRSVLPADALAEGAAERAARESGGNPALLGQLLQRCLLGEALAPEQAAEVGLDLPADESAHARIARLSPAERGLLGRAASFGPVFWTGGLVALGRLSAEPPDAQAVFAPDPAIEEVRRLLAGLAERDFVLAQPVSTVAGEAEWSFCHDLERALLLGAIDPELTRRRQRFAAQWLEGKLQTPASSERLELLGALYQEGGDPRRAGQCFLAAGDSAHRKLRFERARALYLRGLGLLDLDDCVRQIDAYHKLGDLSARLGRTREALAHFGTMLRLSWRLDLPAKGGAAHGRIGRLYRTLGDLGRSLEHFQLARVLFEVAGERPGLAAALDDMGRIHFLRGDLETSLALHRSALSLREELADDRGRAVTLSWMGLCDLQRGNLAGAGGCFRQALALARQSGDPQAIVFSLIDLARLETEAGRPSEADRPLREARELARTTDDQLQACHVGLQMGQCLLAQGRPGEAEVELLAARATAQSHGAKRLAAEIARSLAEARLAQGDAAGARDHAAQAVGYARAVEAPVLHGTALRALASAVAAGAEVETAEGGPREMFDRAIELLATASAELELGRTLSAYADYEETSGHPQNALDLRAQAGAISRQSRRPDTPTESQAAAPA
jgi:tetratricopeptide (TPR) repeat protein